LKTARAIPDHDRLFIITAAISNAEGLATMNAYGPAAASSSLNAANKSEPWGFEWFKTQSCLSLCDFLIPVL
jgi:hypothetical protein